MRGGNSSFCSIELSNKFNKSKASEREKKVGAAPQPPVDLALRTPHVNLSQQGRVAFYRPALLLRCIKKDPRSLRDVGLCAEQRKLWRELCPCKLGDNTARFCLLHFAR